MQIERPNIATVENGQVLGASVLNSYRRGCEYLYGVSHGTKAMTHATSWSVYQSSYQTVWTGWCEHICDTAFYALRMKNDWGNEFDRTWAYRLQIYDDADTWQTIKSGSGTANSYQLIQGTASLASFSLTDGEPYAWRLQIHSDAAEDVHALVDFFGAGERKSVSGWILPHTFTTAASSAPHLNGLRTDLLALADALPRHYAGQLAPAEGWLTPDIGSWAGFSSCAWRYRPGSVYCQVQAKIMAARTWKWRLVVQDTNGNTATVYTASDITGTDAYQTDSETVDLTSGSAATALASAGITMTKGSWYKLHVQFARGVSDHTLQVRHATMLEMPQASAFGGWGSMSEVSCGDAPSVAVYNSYSTNLLALYAGSEALMFDLCASTESGSAVGCSLFHCGRYLHYKGPSSAVLYYGVSLSQTYALPSESTAGVSSGEWIVVDLDAVGVPYGLHYWVDNVDCAYESEG